MAPCLELGGHSHWVWQAKFNPWHDSLLLSASSDSVVNLWHTPLVAGESSRGQGGSRGVQGDKAKALAKRHMMAKPALMMIMRIVYMVMLDCMLW